MRRRTALACVALALVAGAGTGVALRTGLPPAAGSPARSGPVSAPPLPTTRTRSASPTQSATPTAHQTPTAHETPTARETPAAHATTSPGRDDLVSVEELDEAGWRGARTSTAVASDEVDPVVSPCQRPGPFTGLEGVVVGRWQGPAGRVGEVVAEAPTVSESRRRANEAYEQHVRCAELAGRSVGERHAITVDGGSITWFEVSRAGRTGTSAVVRQSDRFAVLYADESQVPVRRLPDLLRDAATRLR